MLMELMFALAVLVAVGFPLAYSFSFEQRALRNHYWRAVAMEIVDGEMEALAAGDWRRFRQGPQEYTVKAEAGRNLPLGRFLLTLAGTKLKLEWVPQQRNHGGKVVREAVGR